MIRLHLLLRDHPDAVEADLLRFWGVDFLDYLRTPRRLSTRRLLVMRRNLPRGQGSAVLALDGPEWTHSDDIADQTRRVLSIAHLEGHKDPGPHQAHPTVIQRSRPDPRRDRLIRDAQARRKQRAADIAAGLIT